jgi:hypothetical protein
LGGTNLQGANLQSVELYGAIIEHSGTALVDLRSARWTPLNEQRLAEMRKILGKTIADIQRRKAALERIERAGHAGVPPPIIESCLIDPEVTPVLTCQQQWLPAEVEAFQRELFPVLEGLACQSSERGLIRQVDTGGAFDSGSRDAS